MMPNTRPLLFLIVLIGQLLQGQIIEIVMKSGDEFEFHKQFKIEKRQIVFLKDQVPVKSLPIMSIDYVSYYTKSYASIGNPFQVMGGLAMGSSLAASLVGHVEYLTYGLPSGLLLTGLGRLMNFLGQFWGKDEIVYDFNRLKYKNRLIIFESIRADMNRKYQTKKSIYQEGTEGESQHDLFGRSRHKALPEKEKKKKRRKKWLELS